MSGSLETTLLIMFISLCLQHCVDGFFVLQRNHLVVMLVWRVNWQTYMFHLEVSLVSPFSMPCFDNFGGILCCGTILTYYNVKKLGGVHKDNFFPMFQSGSGKAVLLNKDSIQKARVVLEGRK